MGHLTDVEKYRERVSAEVRPVTDPHYDQYSGLYFFLSLDLVNSTAYKAAADNADWKYRIRMFYDEAKNFWTTRQTDFAPRIWKYAGDEVLFYSRIRAVSELEEAVEASYLAMSTVANTVGVWTKSQTPRLSVKATCWCANAAYQKPAPESDLPTRVTESNRNIVFQSPIGTTVSSSVLDFLGPEIDTGFRIATRSVKRSLVVSAEAAHLLWERGKREHGDRLRVVEFRELKGVWDGRHYPIVWYRSDWTEQALNEDYDYDDRHKSSTLDSAYETRPDSANQLGSILGQVNREWLTKLDLPATRTAAQVDDEEAALAMPSMEVHAVAVCIRADGRVLVAKRPASKRTFPNMWEAGGAQLRAGEDFFEAMKRDYRADFAVELSFDRFRKWGAVGTYTFLRGEQQIPGVIFVADVKNADELLPSKHADARWINPLQPPEDVRSQCVPDLIERLVRARKLWEETSRASQKD